MFSLHTHSGQFCCHASGSLEDVVHAAIARGFVALGLSEHMPRTRAADLYPEEAHLSPRDLDAMFSAYVHEARALQVKYADRLRILVGAETEYIYPGQVAEVRALVARHQLDYIVGSVHHVGDGIPFDLDVEAYDRALAAHGGSAEALAAAYFDAQHDMLVALQPDVVGHMDLVRLFRPDALDLAPDALWRKIQRNVDVVVAYGGLFELNTSAWAKDLPEPYPCVRIIRYIQACGGRFTLADDSHAPERVGQHYDRLYALAREMGINDVYSLAKSDSGQVHVAHRMPHA